MNVVDSASRTRSYVTGLTFEREYAAERLLSALAEEIEQLNGLVSLSGV